MRSGPSIMRLCPPWGRSPPICPASPWLGWWGPAQSPSRDSARWRCLSRPGYKQQHNKCQIRWASHWLLWIICSSNWSDIFLFSVTSLTWVGILSCHALPAHVIYSGEMGSETQWYDLDSSDFLTHLCVIRNREELYKLVSRAGIEGRLKQNYLKIFDEHFREISFNTTTYLCIEKYVLFQYMTRRFYYQSPYYINLNC